MGFRLPGEGTGGRGDVGAGQRVAAASAVRWSAGGSGLWRVRSGFYLRLVSLCLGTLGGPEGRLETPGMTEPEKGLSRGL